MAPIFQHYLKYELKPIIKKNFFCNFIINNLILKHTGTIAVLLLTLSIDLTKKLNIIGFSLITTIFLSSIIEIICP